MNRLEENRIKPHKIHSVETAELEGGGRMFVMLDKGLELGKLPEGDVARRYVPKRENYRHIAYTTSFLKTGAAVMESIRRGETLRIEGATGFGKSTLIETVCAQAELPLIDINVGPETKIGDLVGRFVPKEATLQSKFFEILKAYELAGSKDGTIEPLQKETLEIMKKADSELRNLGLDDVLKIVSLEKERFSTDPMFDKLMNPEEWEWHNGPLTGAMRYGGIFLINEANFFKFLERFNSVMDYNPKLTIIEHVGEIIRRYLPSEEELAKVSGKNLPGIYPTHPLFSIVLTQNPVGYGAGRIMESPALRDRPRTIPVEKTTEEDYDQTLEFWLTGRQPVVQYKGDTYYGPEEIGGVKVESEFASIEEELKANGIDVQKFAKTLSHIHFWFDKLSTSEGGSGQIGADWEMEGGDYTYTYRKLIRFMKQFRDGFVIDKPSRRTKGIIKNNLNIRDRVEAAFEHAYIETSAGQSKDVITEIIDKSGILDMCGTSINNPQKPDWVKAKEKEGINVELDEKGEWSVIDL